MRGNFQKCTAAVLPRSFLALLGRIEFSHGDISNIKPLETVREMENIYTLGKGRNTKDLGSEKMHEMTRKYVIFSHSST